MATKLLFYVKKTEKRDSILKLCRTLDIDILELSQGDLSKKISSLLGFEMLPLTGEKQEIPAFYAMPEVLLFSGFQEDELDYFLKCYRENGIERVSLKAVATPYNLTWSLYQLISELQEEEKALQK